MSFVLDEVLDAARDVGAPVAVLPPGASDAIRQQVVARYVGRDDVQPMWEHLRGATGVQDPEAWRWIGRFLTEDPVLLLFDLAEERLVVRVDHGTQLVPVLAAAVRFEFYVTNDSYDFLLCVNHHDFLLAAGSAVGWLEGEHPAAREDTPPRASS